MCVSLTLLSPPLGLPSSLRHSKTDVSQLVGMQVSAKGIQLKEESHIHLQIKS